MSTLAGLPEVAPAEAQLRNDVLAALCGSEVGPRVIAAKLPASVPAQMVWFHCSDRLAFAIERLNGEVVAFRPDDGIGAAQVLADAERLLLAVERALGIELEPDGLGPRPADEGLLRVVVETFEASDLYERLHLLLPLTHRLVVDRAPFAATLIHNVPMQATIRFAGPRLQPLDAAGLAAGDLLLLGSAPFAASLSFLDRHCMQGRFDPVARRFTSEISQEERL